MACICNTESIYSKACFVPSGLPGFPHSNVTAGQSLLNAIDCTPLGLKKYTIVGPNKAASCKKRFSS